MKSQTDNKLSTQSTSEELSEISNKSDGLRSNDNTNHTSNKIKVFTVLLMLSAITVGFLYYKKNNAEKEQEEYSEKAAVQQESTGMDTVIFHDLDELIVNLDNNGKDNAFLKIKITLEIRDKESLEVVKKMMPKINDVLLVYLKTLKPSDLKGSIGLYRLREELMIRFNKIIAPAQISDVLFKDFIMQ